MARRTRGGNRPVVPVTDHRHTEPKRENNPPVKIAAESRVPLIPRAAKRMPRKQSRRAADESPGALLLL